MSYYCRLSEKELSGFNFFLIRKIKLMKEEEFGLPPKHLQISKQW